jgi:phosphate transport system substrate-binding protein
MKPRKDRRRRGWRECLPLALSILAGGPAMRAFAEPAGAARAPAPEALVIIVNKANPVDNLTSDELRKYFRLERERWPDGRRNSVLMLPPGTPEREIVLGQIYRLTDGEFARYFFQASYTGQIHSAPKELASAVNVRKFVFNVPGAIGYVRLSQVDDTVKIVRIDGRLPGDADYPMKISAK